MATSNLASFTSGMTPDQVRALSNQYISAGGVPNIDNGQYWVDKYAQWGNSSPAYEQTRLEQGIGDQPGYNGAFGNVTTPANAAQTTPLAGLPPLTPLSTPPNPYAAVAPTPTPLAANSAPQQQAINGILTPSLNLSNGAPW